jgi:hypothetical protein
MGLPLGYHGEKNQKKGQAGAISQEYAMVPVDALETHPRNVNQGDIGAIYESIGANGFYGAIALRARSSSRSYGTVPWPLRQLSNT